MTFAMNSPIKYRNDEQVPLPERRSLLGMLAIVPLGLSAALLAGCENSIPPREVKRPPSYIIGGNGKR